MNINIRTGVFETNSSSVHSCSICTEDTFKKFNDGEVWIKGEDDYLPKDEAIEYNLNAIKEDIPEDKFEKFSEVYRDTCSFYEAYDAIDEEFRKWDIDPWDFYLDSETFWEYHEYEDWSKGFTDSNGTPMIAWGYCGHD